MTPEQEARAQEIALVALGLSPQERGAFLRRRAAGEPEVLAEVRRRLELAGEVPDGFLEEAAVEIETGAAPGNPVAAPPSDAELGELPFAEGRRYRLLEVLGRGGMGVVYRAHDRRLDRQVAIKRLHRALASDSAALERFEREARAAARASHPAIVEVFDVLRDRDDLWIVMELVRGRSLADLWARGPLEIAEALVLATDLAAGLAAAHEVGILHHDLKAENVMVTLEGRAKILDFGLAAPVPSDDQVADEERHGTPVAMSPERITCCRLDARSDLFSLGALLYEMVTGVAPFAGSSTMVILDRVRHLRPPIAGRLNPAVPDELSELIEALLEKDPERRPRGAAEVRSTLARLWKETAGTAERRRGAEPAGTPGTALPSAGAERRLVTLMSCQLVAGGATGALLDPEELMAVEGRLRELAQPVLERWKGHLETWLDGGLRACFGFPRAREDDPRRAVSAALELAAAVEGWDAVPGGLRLRAGVHTGPIAVAAGPDGRRQIVVGRTGCCATHLRSAEVLLPPEPGAVLVTSTARELLDDRFRCEPLGACSVGMCLEPLEAFQVRWARDGEAPAGETPAATPFAGRLAELELLRGRWRDAAAGRGRAVLVHGEAGSGKTRLLRELWRLPDLAAARRLEIACRPGELARWLAEVLGAPESEAEEAPDALVRRLAEGAASAAVVLAVEDVHRADPEDLDLLGLLLDQTPSSALLLLLTCRPSFDPGWKPSPSLTVCSLGPLRALEARRMLRHLAADRPLGAAEEEIVAAADGVPRFVEELGRTFLRALEASAEGPAAPGAEPAGPGPPVPVPASLASWLTARLDRLGDAREVARAASVLGREFSREALSALLPGAAGDTVDRGLERLVEAGYLERRGGRWSGRYRFRYALDRSAAWHSLLGPHRQLYRQRAV